MARRNGIIKNKQLKVWFTFRTVQVGPTFHMLDKREEIQFYALSENKYTKT
jgi:hypothetical protein